MEWYVVLLQFMNLVFHIDMENVERTFAELNAQVSGILDTQNNM